MEVYKYTRGGLGRQNAYTVRLIDLESESFFIPLFAPRFLFVGYLLFGRAFLLGGLDQFFYRGPS